MVWRGKTVEDERFFFTASVMTWVNPRPEVPVESIDLVSEGRQPAPILFGITAVPAGSLDLRPAA